VSARLVIADVRQALAEIPTGSVDLVLTSPPYLALRSYLPSDHPMKHLEIGSEPTPALFISTLLALTAEFRRVLSPHGSIAIELGDTYSGSGGAGGDYSEKGLREGQPRFRQGYDRRDGRSTMQQDDYGVSLPSLTQSRRRNRTEVPRNQKGGGIDGWPLERCLTMVPELYRVALAYGANPLTGEESPAGRWRVRNVVVHGRPNPPVGALGDKFRPACSYWAVACVDRRWFDMEAVRTEPKADPATNSGNGYTKGNPADSGRVTCMPGNPGGAPPLDWFEDDQFAEDLWTVPTAPYPGAHYATFSGELVRRFVLSMCPQRVCRVCGKPSKRLTAEPRYLKSIGSEAAGDTGVPALGGGLGAHSLKPVGPSGGVVRQAETVGWSDCGCPGDDRWRRGVVLDPFAGSGMTLAVAEGCGRDSIGIDIDDRNVELAFGRCGLFLEIQYPEQHPGAERVRASGETGA
jgi:site-specific DNA-methyltransferase (cytosine-N4-specific)